MSEPDENGESVDVLLDVLDALIRAARKDIDAQEDMPYIEEA